LAFDFSFSLFSPFLGMHSLHRTWGDALIARGHCSCFISFYIYFLSFAFHFDFSILLFSSFFCYQAASTSSIQAPSSHGIMKHEPICVTYDQQLKSEDNSVGKDGEFYVWIRIWTHYPYQSPPVVQLHPRVNIYLRDGDDQQGETRQKAQI
jgi:hypothetical protein